MIGVDVVEPYKEMYHGLFNAITTALDVLEKNPALARLILMEAQMEAEDLYLNQEE